MQSSDSPQWKKVTIEDRLLGRYLPFWLKAVNFCTIAFLLALAIGSGLNHALYNFLENPFAPVAIILYCLFFGSELLGRQQKAKNAEWFTAQKKSSS
jgi:hypothetical protein